MDKINYESQLRCAMPGCGVVGNIKPYHFWLPQFDRPVIVGHLCKMHRKEAAEIVESKLRI